MKRVLVTGSEGEVGRDLLPQLARDFTVTGFDREPGSNKSIHSIRGDLTDYPAVATAMQGIESVVHMAALLAGDEDQHFVDANVKATANVLRAAVENGVRRVVYCSTVWASGHGANEPYQPIDENVPCEPVCIYGTTKWIGELLADFYRRQYQIEVVIIRFAGYHHVRGYLPDGSINWEVADAKAICSRYFGDGFKLMNPRDLGTAFGLAVDTDGVSGERFIIGCHTPFTSDDQTLLLEDPASVAEGYYPGSVEFLKALDVELRPVHFYFSHRKAESVLGFRSQHDFASIMDSYRQWKQE